jgi:hypothetical protein
MQRYLIAALSLLAGLLAGLVYHHIASGNQRDREVTHLIEFREELYETERFFIEKLPIYEDWADSKNEPLLRKYLLKDHLAIVKKAGLEPIERAEDIKGRVESGKLIALPQDLSTPYYFYNVRSENRYLHPAAHEGLLEFAERFHSVLHRNLGEQDEFKPLMVKFAISSALRPVQYQNDLRQRNANASLVSSHSYGLSFDLFYDSFYVKLAAPSEAKETGSGETEEAMEDLRRRGGFLLGASLRRQFRAALAETLVQMQKEGMLYAIYERNQRCYHVTIIPDHIRNQAGHF